MRDDDHRNGVKGSEIPPARSVVAQSRWSSGLSSLSLWKLEDYENQRIPRQTMLVEDEEGQDQGGVGASRARKRISGERYAEAHF